MKRFIKKIKRRFKQDSFLCKDKNNLNKKNLTKNYTKA